MRIRKSVMKFAERMETRLKENDHKVGWKSSDPGELLDKLEGEVAELKNAMFGMCPTCCNPEYHGEEAYFDEGTEDPKDEAVDVAIYAMMIADTWKEPKK